MPGCSCELLCRVHIRVSSSCLRGSCGKVQCELGSLRENEKIGSKVFPLETREMRFCGEGLPVSAGLGQMYSFVSFSES